MKTILASYGPSGRRSNQVKSFIKVLEGENKDVIEAQQKLFKERALPLNYKDVIPDDLFLVAVPSKEVSLFHIIIP